MVDYNNRCLSILYSIFQVTKRRMPMRVKSQTLFMILARRQGRCQMLQHLKKLCSMQVRSDLLLLSQSQALLYAGFKIQNSVQKEFGSNLVNYMYTSN